MEKVLRGTYPRIIIGKILKDRETITMPLYLRVLRPGAELGDLEWLRDLDLKYLRVFGIFTDETSTYNALEERENLIKAVVHQKWAGGEFTTDSTKTTFIDTTYKIDNPGRPSYTEGNFDFHKIGEYSIHQKDEEFNMDYIMCGACLVKPPRLGIARTVRDLTVTYFSLKVNSESYPLFLRTRTDGLTDAEKNKVIYVDKVQGEDSFLTKVNAFPNDFGKTQIIKRQAASFSDLFPSVVNDELSLSYFFDLRRLLSNESEAFAALSEKFQQKSIENTAIISNTLYKRRVIPNSVGTLPDFDQKKDEIEDHAENPLRLNDISEELSFFTAKHDINTYSEEVFFGYRTHMMLKNGVVVAVNELKNNIVKIEEFRSFMQDIYSRPYYYRIPEEEFVRSRMEELKETLKSELKIGTPQVSRYLVNLLKELTFSIKELVSEDNIYDTRLSLLQLERAISFDPTQVTNRETFNLFFETYDKVKDILDKILNVTGYSLLVDTYSKTGKTLSGGDKQIIKYIKDFSYVFEPKRYSLRYSHIKDESFLAGGGVNIPQININTFADDQIREIQKYFSDAFVTTNSTLTPFERSAGYEGKINLDRTNFIAPKIVKIGSNPIVDISSSRDWDTSYFLNAVLNILMYEVFSQYPTDVGVFDPSVEIENINEKLTKIFNSLSLRGLSLVGGLLHLDTLFYPLGAAGETPPSAETEELAGVLDTTEAVGEGSSQFSSVFLDILDRYIETYPDVLNSLSEYNIGDRTSQTLLNSFINKALDSALPIELPFPLYALYENVMPSSVLLRASGFVNQTPFIWNDRNILQNPSNMPVIRLNFANINKIEKLDNFATYGDGTLNLKKPIYKEIDYSEDNFQNDSLLNLFCRMTTYNYGFENTAWYLNSVNNLLALSSEAEHFIMQKDSSLTNRNLVFLRGAARQDLPATVLAGNDNSTETTNEFAGSGAAAGALSEDDLEDAVERFNN